MMLIVGLGNPGPEYEDSRHNIGFMVVDKLVRELSTQAVAWSDDKKHGAHIVKVGDVILAKPQTFMNASGEAVSGLSSFYKIKPTAVWVVHDDIDLPLGKIRIRQQGGSAGHNGVLSVITHLKSDTFVRFRLGVGRGKELSRREDRKAHHQSIVDFVLSRFRQSEAGELKHLIKHGTEAVRLALSQGVDKAMNRYN